MFSTRDHFLESLRSALHLGVGFAAGKLGYSEQVWWAGRHSIAESGANSAFQKAIRASVRFHATMQLGSFPDTDEYLDATGQAFAQSVLGLDFLAVHASSLSNALLSGRCVKPQILDFGDLEPNRDSPYLAVKCYLPDFRGKKVLLVTSPARLLASRANQRDFENTWRSIGCPWFEPHSVEPLAFPSMFDERTHDMFLSSQELLEDIGEQLAQRDFDVALIAASSLGIPIAERVKNLGKIGLSLGGHLQVLFGVQGKRWRENPEWQKTYVNEYWINMPHELRPITSKWLVDDGAYW